MKKLILCFLIRVILFCFLYILPVFNFKKFTLYKELIFLSIISALKKKTF